MSSLKMLAKLSRKYIQRSKTSVIYLMVEMEATEKSSDQNRLPLNVGFVLDRSGSMTGGKLDFTKQAVSYALGHTTAKDWTSVTVFDDQVQVLVESQQVELKDSLKGAISRIYPGGSTNLSGGLIAGYREVMKHFGSSHVNRVLLLTDGLANVGITDRETLCSKVAGMKKSGIAVSTLGVGDDFDEDLLTVMAETSGGNYYFIDSTERIPEIFAKELQALLSVIAQNVKMSFRCADSVSVSKVWGYRPSGDRTLEFVLPDMFSSDRKVVVMELEVVSSQDGELPLGTLTVSYDDAGANLECMSWDIDLTAICTEEQSELSTPDEPEVMVQVELNRAAEAKEQAVKLADQGDLQGASALMDESSAKLSCVLACAPSSLQDDLREELDSLLISKNVFESQSYDARARKNMTYSSYQRRNTRRK